MALAVGIVSLLRVNSWSDRTRPMASSSNHARTRAIALISAGSHLELRFCCASPGRASLLSAPRRLKATAAVSSIALSLPSSDADDEVPRRYQSGEVDYTGSISPARRFAAGDRSRDRRRAGGHGAYRLPRRPESEADQLSLATLSGLGCFPTIPQRECALVPCPNKILLSNARPALTIQKGGTPVWGLRSKSYPLLVRPELAIPIVFSDLFLSIFHSVSSQA
jgi:hypothetical protein